MFLKAFPCPSTSKTLILCKQDGCHNHSSQINFICNASCGACGSKKSSPLCSVHCSLPRFSLSQASLRPFASTLHFYSSSAKRPSSDDNLLRVLESEIKYSEESDDHDGLAPRGWGSRGESKGSNMNGSRNEEAPDGFPFEIQDNPGQQTISLAREYQGEVIKVEVHMPDLVTGEGDDDNNDDDNEKGNQSSIPLVVSVSKKNGPFLEFGCTAFADEIAMIPCQSKIQKFLRSKLHMRGLTSRKPFQDLDENLQKAFHKYLEIRGIKPSTTNFLHEYMINKDSREYLLWLKNLKKFVEA
ncbi:Uncharacterized protein, mitochondrial [Vitis vinifera]|uniref:Uncharacterized protein, mitochondrial n=1 Tax=Vitis vinifera TaxID=29760 RepID=A0A438ENK2_VITVI|nr:Uncharacterized protein, mitochondrial [Vitis vinifera]